MSSSSKTYPCERMAAKTPTEATPSPRSGVEDSTETLKGLNIEPITRNPPVATPAPLPRDRPGINALQRGITVFDHDHPPNALTTRLEAAHIIPFALGSIRASDSETSGFTKNSVNSTSFLEAAGVPHQYRIKAFPGAVPTSVLPELPENSLVAFKVPRGSLGTSRPRFLQIHACIGNFLHMSGQGEIIDKILRDFGDCGGLAPDGGTNLEDLLAGQQPLATKVKESQPETPGDPNSAEKQRDNVPGGSKALAPGINHGHRRTVVMVAVGS
ncbi:uncharacterized protein N7515_000002 [Penicillium bovifimosum]|uniref:HNH nuclease domain-containing protein n=1 Tax=Penicillium bovifimosum TaxID=126998 RepID=A0A9W9HEU6_9EURO|nr:uncharacterized protein N7515_000002 [Penicillium bovifimosum]KAJ5145438.1 hypothetical protein N7515_000002 [Penicillium bovifimosum]